MLTSLPAAAAAGAFSSPPSPAAASAAASSGRPFYAFFFGAAYVNENYFLVGKADKDTTIAAKRDRARCQELEKWLLSKHPTARLVTFNEQQTADDCSPNMHIGCAWGPRCTKGLLQAYPEHQFVGNCGFIFVDYFRSMGSYRTQMYFALFSALKSLLKAGIISVRTRIIVPMYSNFQSDFDRLCQVVASAQGQLVLNKLMSSENPLYTTTDDLVKRLTPAEVAEIFGAYTNVNQLPQLSEGKPLPLPFREIKISQPPNADLMPADSLSPLLSPVFTDNLWQNPRAVLGQSCEHTPTTQTAPSRTLAQSAAAPLVQTETKAMVQTTPPVLTEPVVQVQVPPPVSPATLSSRSGSNTAPATALSSESSYAGSQQSSESSRAGLEDERKDADVSDELSVKSPFPTESNRIRGASQTPTESFPVAGGAAATVEYDLLGPLQFARAVVANLAPVSAMRKDAPGLILLDTSGTTLPQYQRPLSLVYLSDPNAGESADCSYPYYIFSSRNDNECALRSLMLSDVRTSSSVSSEASAEHLEALAEIRQLTRDPFTGHATIQEVNTDARIGPVESAAEMELALIHKFRVK